MARSKKPWIRSRRVALWLGYGGLLIGTVAMFDAYENRGRQRNFLASRL